MREEPIDFFKPFFLEMGSLSFAIAIFYKRHLHIDYPVIWSNRFADQLGHCVCRSRFQIRFSIITICSADDVLIA